MKSTLMVMGVLTALLWLLPGPAFGQTGFSYQGRLLEAGEPVDWEVDIKFTLYDAEEGGLLVAGPLVFDGQPGAESPVAVAAGLFTAVLDFGDDTFDGQTLWLAIEVRSPHDPGDTEDYVLLTTRQPLTPTPYAIFSHRNWALIGNAGVNPATDFVGTSDNQPLIVKVNNQRALRIEPDPACPNLIGGHGGNTAGGASGAVISGGGGDGALNSVTSDYGAVGGGSGNTAGGAHATVGGGGGNNADGSFYPTVGGGNNNTAGGQRSTVSGGGGNSANATASTVGGGDNNTADGTQATVGGGRDNVAGDYYAAVGGGMYNEAVGPYRATIAGGGRNLAGGDSATIGGGYYNKALADYATISGGGPSDTGDPENTNNRVWDNYGVVGGGGGNNVGFDDADPDAQSYATIAGGQINTAGSAGSTVGGGVANSALTNFTTVSGGNMNSAQGEGSAIGGGLSNGTNGGAIRATIGGGEGNSASGSYNTIGGGKYNDTTNLFATVGGGTLNSASGDNAVVAGGSYNTTNAYHAAIGGGFNHTVNGQYATVPGGYFNHADGDYSFAAGRQARANDDGAFVWADSTGGDFTSTGDDQFLIRAAGNVGVGVTDPSEQIDTIGTARLRGIEIAASSYPNVVVDDDGKLWEQASSIRYKTNIADLDANSDAVLSLRPVSFQWKTSGRQDIGLIAEEVDEVLTDLVIYGKDGRPNSVKYDRVAVYLLPVVKTQQARIEALEVIAKQKNAELASLRNDNVELRTLIGELAERLERLERAPRSNDLGRR